MKYCKACQCDTERYANGQCKPCAKANSAAWRLANPEKDKADKLAYYLANAEKCKADQAAYYAANAEKVKAKKAAWAKENPEAIRIKSANRRAMKLAAGGKLSKDLSAKLFELQRGKCACCGQPLGKGFHLDHIMPIALNGENIDSNIQLLRRRCNNQKHAKHPVDFMQSRGKLL